MKKLLSVLLASMLLAAMLVQPAMALGETGSVVSVGFNTTYVIKNDGTLWGCGKDYVGTGGGFGDPETEMTHITDDVRSVSANANTTLVVKKDNTLWGWGYLYGYPRTPDEKDPEFLYPTKLNIDDVKSVSAGYYYMLVLKNDNTLWISGEMYKGDGTETWAYEPVGFEKIADNVIDMFAATEAVLYVKDDNTLWGYGESRKAVLGYREDGPDYLEPKKILDDVKYISANEAATAVCAIRLDNSLWAWSDDGLWTDNKGWVDDKLNVYKVTENVKMAIINSSNGFVVKNDNTLWGWGYSYQGADVNNDRILRKISDNVSSISHGYRHLAIIKTDNTLWTMGGNTALGYSSEDYWYNPLTKIMNNVQDSPSSWAVAEVEGAINAGLIPNDMQGNYTKTVTREEFCILAIRMIETRAGMDIGAYLDMVGVEIAPSGTFEDCDTYEVRAAKALGITDGTSATTFTPDKELTRQEAAKFLTATAIACGYNVTLSTPGFSDSSAIADWAKPYIGYVFDIGVMSGVGSNRFDPLGSYQRQQAFMTMYRIWQVIAEINADTAKESLAG
jgi:alpha-tubulin suppressor-like RCC1 family protein